ncbi:MAG: hypothetical protein PHR35_21330, partial [Kiritimatiellae bacterium]|nr:hypothetical protein [Kiritimatiellia bacterium]
GPSVARAVELSDTPPSGTTAQSPLTYALGDLDANVTTSLQFTVDVHAGTQGWITNRATVVCANDSNLVNNVSEVVTLIAPVADVSVIKSGPATGVAGAALTYTLTVANVGPSVARAVELSDTPPSGTTAQSPLTYTLGDLAVGVSTSLQFTVDVHADTQGWITNRAAVACASDTNLVNNASEVVTLIAPVADVSVLKTGPATGVAGEALTYMLTVSNAGPSLATGIMLADSPPAGTTALSPTNMALSALAPGAASNIVFHLQTHPDLLGWITNRAVAVCGADTNHANDAAEAVTLIGAEAALRVEKWANASSVHGGTPVVFEIAVTNAGPSLARNLRLEDRQTGVSGSLLGPAGPTNGFDFTWSELAPGGALRLTVTAETYLVEGALTNRVTLLSDTLDTNSADNVSQAIVLVTLGTESIAVSASWTLKISTGLFDAAIAIRNDGTLPLANRDFWLALAVTAEWWLWNPSGTMPDGKTYYNLTDAVRAALLTTGNRDAVFDPGETVTVQGPQIYHRRRVNPRNYVNASSDIQFGLLFSKQDINHNFRVEADEVERVSGSWRSGVQGDRALIEATRLHRGAAYIWDAALGTWRVLADDTRD